MVERHVYTVLVGGSTPSVRTIGGTTMSLDFIYDLTDKLDEQKIEYTICIIRHGKKDSKIDIHYNIQSDDSLDMMCKSFEKLCSGDIPEDGNIEIDLNDDDDDS